MVTLLDLVQFGSVVVLADGLSSHAEWLQVRVDAQQVLPKSKHVGALTLLFCAQHSSSHMQTPVFKHVQFSSDPRLLSPAESLMLSSLSAHLHERVLPAKEGKHLRACQQHPHSA